MELNRNWSQAFGVGMCRRAQDLRSVGDLELAQQIEERAALFQSTPKTCPENSSGIALQALCIFDQSAKSLWLEDLLSLIERCSHWIPTAQVEEYRERGLNLGDDQLFVELLFELRQEVQTRIWRSWKATHHQKDFLPPGFAVQSQGRYNNRSNLEEFLEMVAVSDPIWAADFGELYQRLGSWQKSLSL